MLQPRVTLALVLVQVFFGVHYFVVKLILESMSPRAWAALRISGAAVILMGYNLLFLRRHPKGKRDVGRLLVFAFFGVMLNQVLFAEGLSRTTPAHSAVINSLIPVLTLAFAILLRQEHGSPGRWLSIGVALASVLVLLGVENFRLHDELVAGDLLTLANGSSFSLFLVLSRDYLRRTDPLAATSYLLTFGALGILVAGGAPLAATRFEALPPHFWWLAAYAIVFATVLAYFLNYYALRHTDSSTVALFIYLQPPIATALSMLFLDERPTPRFWIATAGIFCGVYLAVRARRRSQPTMSGPMGRRPAKPAS